MSKYCQTCGAEMSDEQAFCPRCGTPADVPAPPVAPEYGAPQGYENAGEPVYTQEPPQQKKKGSSWLPIVLIALLIVLAAIWFFYMRVPAVESIAIQGGSTYDLMINDSQSLSYTIEPEKAKDAEVTWSSSDESVATVSSSGRVTAVDEGTATITAEAGGKTASVKVNVTALRPEESLLLGMWTGIMAVKDDSTVDLTDLECTLELNDDMTGRITLVTDSDTSKVDITWEYWKTDEDGDYFYNYADRQGSSSVFLYSVSEEFIMLSLGEDGYVMVFER